MSSEYLLNGLQGHPAVYVLDSNGSFLLRFLNDVSSVLRKVFRRFLNEKFEDNFERFFRLGHIYFDLVVFRMSDYAWKTNFWCHILIDGLITNQIALLLPVRGWTEFGKMFGIDCRRFLFSPPPPPSRSPPPHFFPMFLLTPGMFLHLPAFSLACSISAWKKKGIGCSAG